MSDNRLKSPSLLSGRIKPAMDEDVDPIDQVATQRERGSAATPSVPEPRTPEKTKPVDAPVHARRSRQPEVLVQLSHRVKMETSEQLTYIADRDGTTIKSALERAIAEFAKR